MRRDFAAVQDHEPFDQRQPNAQAALGAVGCSLALGKQLKGPLEQRWRHALQRRSVRPWAAFADGCQCDRATVETIEARMRIESIERGSWKGMPPIVKPLVWGSARPR